MMFDVCSLNSQLLRATCNTAWAGRKSDSWWNSRIGSVSLNLRVIVIGNQLSGGSKFRQTTSTSIFLSEFVVLI